MNCHIFLAMMVASSTANFDGPMNKLTEELLAEGLMTMDDNGQATTACIVSTANGASTMTLCTATDAVGPQPIGCFSIWNGTHVIQQGCFSDKEIVMSSECKKGLCNADIQEDGRAVCCCFGFFCNA